MLKQCYSANAEWHCLWQFCGGDYDRIFKNDESIPQDIRDKFTTEKAEKEAVADFVARVLFKGNDASLRIALKEKNIKRFTDMETDIDLLEELAQKDRNLFQKIVDAIRDFINSIKGMPNFKDLEQDIKYLEERLARVYESGDKKGSNKGEVVYKGKIKADTEASTVNNESYYVDEIIGADGTNYGIGVYLDSQTLDGLSDEQRIETVKKHISGLGGHSFTAFDNNGDEVEIKVAPKTKYKNEKGNPERANRHLTNYLKNPKKQETLLFIDEVISVATFKEPELATKPHGWLDNNGKNNWDLWTTYIQDKENTIWEAKLKIANSTNGEKILYDVHPIEKVGQGRTLPKSSTNANISQDTENVKQKQLEIISETNPAPNTYQTWVRSVDDIKTLAETLEDSDWQDESINPDLTRTDIQNAIDSGTITVYSSHPIEQGVFVSPSRMEAESYSGDGKVYEQVVSISDVAWIDPTQGQYARVDESYSSDDLNAEAEKLLDRYESGGEMSREEFLQEMDDLYGRAVENYGAFEKGEYNETDIPVPKAVAEDKPTERFARTFVGAAKLTPEMIEQFEKDVLLGEFDYTVASDETAIKKAESVIANFDYL